MWPKHAAEYFVAKQYQSTLVRLWVIISYSLCYGIYWTALLLLSVVFRKYVILLRYKVNIFVLHYQLQFKLRLQPPKICRHNFFPVKWAMSGEPRKNYDLVRICA
jgi:hypothetical protein